MLLHLHRNKNWRGWFTKCLLGVGFASLVAIALISQPRDAIAHAALDQSDPPANAVLRTTPSQVTLTFTERLEHSGTGARLYDQNGAEVAGAATRPGDGPKVLILDLPASLANGTYSVVWETLSADDGHPAQGYFAFTIGTDADVEIVIPPAATVDSSTPGWLRAASRWAALVGLAAVVAIWPIWLVVVRPGVSSVWQIGPRLVYSVRRYAALAVALALAGNLVAVAVQAADLPSGGFFDNLKTTLLDTRYGELWLFRIALLVVVAIGLDAAPWWWPRRRPFRAALMVILAIALPIPFSLISHASAETTGRAAAIAIDYIHLLSASFWVGGIFLLVAVLGPTLADLTSAGRRVVLARAIPRFSMVALSAWSVLGLSGLYSAWLQVGNLDGLTSTAYGQSLLIKLAILLPLLGLGAFNLLIITRKIRHPVSETGPERWPRRFRVVITAELVLMVALLLVIGRLISLPPARGVLEAESGAFHLALEASGRAGSLTITPGATGPNHFRLKLSGDPLPDGTEAVLRLTLTAEDIGEQEIALTRAAGNAFEAHGSELSIAGDWRLTSIVRKIGEFQWQSSSSITVGQEPPSANVPSPAWRFSASGIAGVALIVVAIAGFVLAWSVGRTRLRREAAGLAACALVLGAVLILQARTEPTEATGADQPLTIADQETLTRGESIFTANCVACHGATGKGDGPAAAGLNPPPSDFTSSVHQGHRAEDLALWVRNGVPGSAMPGFASQLTDKEIDDVVAYVQSLSAGSAAIAAELDVPTPEECAVDPVFPEELIPAETHVALAPTPAPEVGSDAIPWPQGEEASSEEIAAVTETVRQFVACANATDYPRQLALYTERSIRPQFAALDPAERQAAIDFATTAPAGLPADERGVIREIRDVRRLPDGRLGAYVFTENPVTHPHEVRVVLIFARAGDRWLIDEIHQDISSDPASPSASSP